MSAENNATLSEEAFSDVSFSEEDVWSDIGFESEEKEVDSNNFFAYEPIIKVAENKINNVPNSVENQVEELKRLYNQSW